LSKCRILRTGERPAAAIVTSIYCLRPFNALLLAGRRSDQDQDASNTIVIAANAGDRDANHAKHLKLDRAGAGQSA